METLGVMELVKKYQLAETSLRRAIKKGMTKKEAVQYCLNNKKNITTISYKGASLNVYEIERLENLKTNSLYTYMKKHSDVDTESAIVYLRDIQSQERTVNDHSQGYLFMNEAGEMVVMSISEIAKISNCEISSLYKKLAMNMTIVDAVASTQKNQTRYYQYKGEPCTIKTISRKSGIPKNYLYTVCEEDDFEENIDFYFKLYKKREILEKNSTSLYEYCVKEGYNYRVVYKLIIKRGLSVDEALKYYKIKGTSPPHNWNYEYNDILLNSLCIKYKLDVDYVRRHVREGLSVKEAIEKCCFCSHTPYSHQYNNNSLNLYYKLCNYSSEKRYDEFQKSSLTTEEKTDFEERYNKVSIIKRDLLLISLYREYSNSSKQRKTEIIKEFNLSKTDINYMENVILGEFVPVYETICLSSKELTKQRKLYYNKPKSKEQE